MITAQTNKEATKRKPEQKGSQNKNQKRSQEQSEKKGSLSSSPFSTSLMTDSYLSSGTTPILNPDFKWPLPMRASPDQRNQSLRCDYHMDHGHETNCCQSLKFLVEKLIRAGHHRSYIRELTRGTETAPTDDRAIASAEHPSQPRPTINFILGGPADDQYQSKRHRRKMLSATSVKA